MYSANLSTLAFSKLCWPQAEAKPKRAKKLVMMFFMVFVCIKFEAVKIGKKIRMDIKEKAVEISTAYFDVNYETLY